MPGPCPWGLLAQALPVPFTLTLHSTGSLCMFSLHRPQEGYYAHFEDEERETEVRAGFSYGQGSGGFMPAASCAEGLVPRIAPLTAPPTPKPEPCPYESAPPPLPVTPLNRQPSRHTAFRLRHDGQRGTIPREEGFAREEGLFAGGSPGPAMHSDPSTADLYSSSRILSTCRAQTTSRRFRSLTPT